MEHEHHPKESVIFHEHDDSNDKMYVIITGKAGIYVQQDVNVFAAENLHELRL
jgi:hypothetical protein